MAPTPLEEGRILADVLPALENIFDAGWLDTVPPIVPLEPKESEARFRGIVQRVLRTFARAGRPLVIMFGGPLSPESFCIIGADP